MIRNVFVSDSTRIKIYTSPGKNIDYDIGQLIQDGLDNRIPFLQINYDSVIVEIPFQRTGHDHYSAKLSFLQTTTVLPGENKIKASTSGIMDALITKENKIIGPDTLSVWVLHLGKIEFR
jgi:hypothetical protein